MSGLEGRGTNVRLIGKMMLLGARNSCPQKVLNKFGEREKKKRENEHNSSRGTFMVFILNTNKETGLVGFTLIPWGFSKLHKDSICCT